MQNLINDYENEQRTQLVDGIDILKSYITPSEQSLNDPYDPQFNKKQEELDNFAASLSKLENEIEYSMELLGGGNYHENELSESSSLYGNTDPQLLIRRNRIDTRFPSNALRPEIAHDDVMAGKEEGQGYSDGKEAGSYGNANIDTYGYESYFKNPASVLKPANKLNPENYVEGTKGHYLNGVEGRYKMDDFERWKEYLDENDDPTYYDLNYLLKKLVRWIRIGKL